MSGTLRGVTVVGTTLLLALPAAAQADRIAVGYTPEAGPQLRAAVRAAHQLQPVARLGSRTWVYSVPHAQRRPLLRQLRATPGVRYAEAEQIMRAATVPNDPDWSSQWGLSKVLTATAWDRSASSPVTVAVVDTGVDMSHPDLTTQLWTNPGEIAGNGIDDDSNGYVDDVHGWDFAAGDADPQDTNSVSHGTHVSGIIGAASNNGVGISGADPNARIMAIRTLGDNGTGSSFWVAAGIQYAVARGAKVINLSLGGGASQAISDAITGAQAAGVLVVAAAGNQGGNNDTPAMEGYKYPSAYPQDNILAVAATTASDALAGFSQYGAVSVDMGAPGDQIYSTLRNGDYGSLSGTSMATPLVAGAAAWLWGTRPSATYAQIRTALMTGGDALTALAGKTVTGKRLNMNGAYTALASLPAVPVNTVAPRATFSKNVASCTTGSWSNSPNRYTYSWARGGVTLAGAVANRYTVVDNDYSQPLSCRVVASNRVGASEAATSAAASVPAPQVRTVPAISGLAKVGSTLTCTAGVWVYGPLSYSYAWQRNGVAIPDATGGAYTLTSSDLRQAVRCQLTVANATGTTAAFTRAVVPRS